MAFTNRKAQALLAWLALNGGHAAGRDRAAALLRGDKPDRRADASPSRALHSIRRTRAEPGCDALLA
ncbi:hypothetical protein [Paralimibaculum aggregatum]|nr:hypothetical protein [Limibaculum sp. NKW23]